MSPQRRAIKGKPCTAKQPMKVMTRTAMKSKSPMKSTKSTSRPKKSKTSASKRKSHDDDDAEAAHDDASEHAESEAETCESAEFENESSGDHKGKAALLKWAKAVEAGKHPKKPTEASIFVKPIV